MDDRFVGFSCLAISAFAWGSNYVPFKRTNTGDGMHVQNLMATGIFFTGSIIYFYLGSPKFEPFAVLGGIIWSTGNLCVVPIMKCIGLSLGLLLWGSSALVIGWATGRFGLFGITQSIPENVGLNYGGVVLCLLGTALYSFVKTEIPKEVASSESAEETYFSIESPAFRPTTPSFFDEMSESQKHILGVSLSLLSGALYGTNTTPPQWLKDHGHSQEEADYVFPHFVGIFLASTFYFTIYCLYCKQKPVLYNKAVLPAYISGILWAIAQASFIVANGKLSFTISYPLGSTAPSLIGALWGLFVFKEIQEPKSIFILVIAFLVSLMGILCIALSA